MGFVEEREEEKDLLDFEDKCQAIAYLEEDLEAFEERLGNLEALYKELHDFCKSREEKKTASPKKK